VVEFGRMQHDDRFAERCRIAGVEGRVPLPVFFPETHHQHVGALDAGADAHGVEQRPLAVVPELVAFGAENLHAAIVGGIVVGHRAEPVDVEALAGRHDRLAPVGMDLTGQVDIELHGNLPFGFAG
jgi:hypothetical protein